MSSAGSWHFWKPQLENQIELGQLIEDVPLGRDKSHSTFDMKLGQKLYFSDVIRTSSGMKGSQSMQIPG